MVKKHFSISLLFIALAILLGHNVFPHHHHNHHNDFDSFETEHHHSTNHSHGDDHHGNDHHREEGFNIGHLFAHFEHIDSEIVILNSLHKEDSVSKKKFQPLAILPKSPLVWCDKILVSQKIPLYNFDFCSHQYFSPTSLRAPPIFIA
jgi:hypothetical protein